jgi:hypothetical protein
MPALRDIRRGRCRSAAPAFDYRVQECSTSKEISMKFMILEKVHAAEAARRKP